jgi:pyruvate kinase
VIEGVLTERDIEYLKEMKQLDLKRVMLSYVESPDDIAQVRQHLPEAEIILKIETEGGMRFARKFGGEFGRLVAARGDLFVEVVKPHRILHALNTIITCDPDAVVASRFFESLLYHPVPDSAEISDAAYLIAIGYRTFLFGDAICLQRDTVIGALNLLDAIVGELQ